MQTLKDRLTAQAREELRILRRSVPVVLLIAVLIWIGAQQRHNRPGHQGPITITEQEHFG